MWDFPRVQIFSLGLIAHWSMRRWARDRPEDRVVTAALTGALLYQASKILPYTPVFRPQVPAATDGRPDRGIRLLAANVLHENRRSDLILQAVREASADVVCLAEPDDWWERELRPLERDYPWVAKYPQGNAYGMLLYSRLPVSSCETRFVVEPDVPSMRAVVQLRSGEEVVVYAVHPRPPLPDNASDGRDAELVLLGREIEREQRPAIVMGDLNDVAWSYTTTLFQRLSHMVDPRVGRGMFSTFHARYPFARYPLDHVFHTRHFTVREIRRLGYTGSDHFPILVDLAFTPSRTHELPRPATTEADRSNAEEILQDQDSAARAERHA